MTDREPGLLEFSRGKLSVNVNVNAGGIGVWLACSAAAVCFVLAVAGALVFGAQSNRQDSEIRDLRRELQVAKDYLAAIYVQAPSLRPKDDQDDRKNSP